MTTVLTLASPWKPSADRPNSNYQFSILSWGRSLRRLEGAGIELSSVQLVHKFAATLSNTKKGFWQIWALSRRPRGLKNTPPNTIKFGKTSKTNRGPSLDPTLDQVLTQRNPIFGPSFDYRISIYIYIYIYTQHICCRVKTWSKNYLFWVNTWSKFNYFPFLSSSFCRESDIFAKEEKEDKNYHFVESKPGPIMLRNIFAPSFDTTLDQVFIQPFWHFLGHFPFSKMPKPLLYSAFSRNCVF